MVVSELGLNVEAFPTFETNSSLVQLESEANEDEDGETSSGKL